MRLNLASCTERGRSLCRTALVSSQSAGECETKTLEVQRLLADMLIDSNACGMSLT